MPIKTLKRIQKVAYNLLTPLDSQELYERCVKQAISLAGAKYGSLFLNRNDQFVRMYTNVPFANRLQPSRGGNTEQALKRGKIMFISRKNILKNHPDGVLPMKFMIIIPLRYQNQNVGVVTLQSEKKIAARSEEKHFLEVFSSLASLAIRNIQLYEDSKAAIKTREVFMSTAAHELKTPLTVLRAYAQMAKKDIDQNKAIPAKFIDMIVEKSDRLQTLIRDLFSASQMKMGLFSYDFQKVNLVNVLSKMLSESLLINKRSIAFENLLPRDEAMINADEEKVSLVFTNILNNAIKYSPSDTPITITLQKRKKNFLVVIHDLGKGISKTHLPHIFEEFYRGDEKGSSGMGLGMYLCKQVIEAHLGEISVASQLGKYTKVSIYLPEVK